jgi:transposase-like protein
MFTMNCRRTRLHLISKMKLRDLVVRIGRPITRVVGALGVVQESLSHWVKAYEDRLQISDGRLRA